ncbi:MAG TPA: SDR family NAD(P)-dependent oxidoreductase [Anaerolineales bacterium]|nr:SDR family NAD(P)-dependent oxidoreductase [Anaerolineales bacterium]
MFDFSNQVFVITGASGNLGSALVERFRSAGAKLVLVERNTDKLKQAFPDLADDPNHYIAGADLTNADAVKAVVEQTIARFGRVDVLVNTIGGFRAGTPLHETPLDTFDFMINLNARTVYIAAQAVMPKMLAQGRGKIISIAARPGLEGRANQAAYSASKAAVIRLTESMAAEYRTQGINVNCIIPGTIDTPQNRAATTDANFSHLVQPESIADVIAFLASDLARDVHGVTLPVVGKS